VLADFYGGVTKQTDMEIVLPNHYLLPETKRPIMIVGAGGIVRAAHLPGYCKAGFELAGITDLDMDKAQHLAEEFGVKCIFSNVEEAVSVLPDNTIYDLATTPDQFLKVLPLLPDGSAVLLQKPLGTSREETLAILELCKKKRLVAAVNFQLRFAPAMVAARYLIDEGFLGQIYDVEMRLTTHTPWEIFPLSERADRLEILYHSIHYIDLIRSFLGDPASLSAKTYGHPLKPFESTRSTILFDYGHMLRAVINTNHDHDFGNRHQESYFKLEGTKGAVKIGLGVLLNYPNGVPDTFEYYLCTEDKKGEWRAPTIDGTWFPDAFTGSMASMIGYLDGTLPSLPTGIDDALRTMHWVECAYKSSSVGGVSAI
jgi:predicted dehydrogenase